VRQLCLGLLLLGLGSTWVEAGAQEVGEPHVLNTSEKWTLDERGREFLHDGVPIELVGNKDGDEGLRVRTPVLSQSNQNTVQVDVEANYKRRLAMYAEGARFHAPLALAAVSASEASPASRAPRYAEPANATSPGEVVPDEPSDFRFYLNCFLASIAVMLGVHLVRTRP